MENSTNTDVQVLESLVGKYKELKAQISNVIVGQEEVVDQLIISIFSNGHCLLVGVPGLAKTLLVNTISSALGLTFNRIQFTPDLMPSDIVGAEILNESRKFEFVKGPIFSNVILADEINRTPPKTQAALLEAMQERAVTSGGKTYKLDRPFFVLATQNPIEQEGTYALPEAQLDRFMFNIWVDYPTMEEELEVVKRTTSGHSQEVKTVLSGEEIEKFQKAIQKMPVADNVYEYAVRLSSLTRVKVAQPDEFVKKYLSWGAGPRASQYLIIGAKTHAALKGKFSPDIEDVKAVAMPILRHRILRNYKAEADGLSIEDIVNELMNKA